jgi:hypothetical protein
MNTYAYIILYKYILLSLVSIPRARTSGSYGNFKFTFLRDYQMFSNVPGTFTYPSAICKNYSFFIFWHKLVPSVSFDQSLALCIVSHCNSTLLLFLYWLKMLSIFWFIFCLHIHMLSLVHCCLLTFKNGVICILLIGL